MKLTHLTRIALSVLPAITVMSIAMAIREHNHAQRVESLLVEQKITDGQEKKSPPTSALETELMDLRQRFDQTAKSYEARISALQSQIVNAPGPVAEVPAIASEPRPEEKKESDDKRKQQLTDFDRAMDQEFARLEQREKTSHDPDDLATVKLLKSKFEALDQTWLKVDSTDDPSAKQAGRQQAQALMGEIITLSAADRNRNLSKVAHQMGYTEIEQIIPFITEVNRIERETHFDWAKLFNRGF